MDPQSLKDLLSEKNSVIKELNDLIHHKDVHIDDLNIKLSIALETLQKVSDANCIASGLARRAMETIKS